MTSAVTFLLQDSTKHLTDFLEANTQGKQSSPNWDFRLVLVRHSVHNVLSGKSRSCATRLHTRWRWNALRAWRSSGAAGRCVGCLVVSHVFWLQNEWTRFWFRDWDWALSLAGNAGEQPALGCGHTPARYSEPEDLTLSYRSSTLFIHNVRMNPRLV